MGCFYGVIDCEIALLHHLMSAKSSICYGKCNDDQYTGCEQDYTRESNDQFAKVKQNICREYGVRIHGLCREQADEFVIESVDAACWQEQWSNCTNRTDQDSRKRCFAGSRQKHCKCHPPFI